MLGNFPPSFSPTYPFSKFRLQHKKSRRTASISLNVVFVVDDVANVWGAGRELTAQGRIGRLFEEESVGPESQKLN